jgi:hypothetical protein
MFQFVAEKTCACMILEGAKKLKTEATVKTDVEYRIY